MRRLFVLALLVASLTGCDKTPACSKLPAPTPAEVTAAEGGAVVERDDHKGRECEVSNRTWVPEAEASGA